MMPAPGSGPSWLCRGSMAVGTVRHPESIVLERIESAGAGSPRYAAVQRGCLRSARVGRRRPLHFVSLLRPGTRISRHEGHGPYDRGGNGGSNSLVEHLRDFQNSRGARTAFRRSARKVDQCLVLFFVLRAAAAMASARRPRVPGLLPDSDLPKRVSTGLRATVGRPF
jgi:hypothetical protein